MNTSITASAASAATAATAIVPRRVERILPDPTFTGSFDANSPGVCTGTPFAFSLLGEDGNAGAQLVLVAWLGSPATVVQGLYVLDEVADDLVLSRRVLARAG